MGLLRKSLIILMFAAVLGLALLGLLFAIAWWRDAPIEITEVKSSTDSSVNLGEVVHFKVIARLPWHRRPIRPPDIDVAAGLQQVDAGPMKLDRIGLGHWRWVARISLQAIDFPSSADSQARLFFTADRHGVSQPVEVSLHFPDVIPRGLAPEDSELSVAGTIDAQEPTDGIKWWRWIGLSGIVLAALAVLIAVLAGGRIREAAPAPFPWDVAEKTLQSIEDRLPMNAGVFFQELTDVLRRYIEMRFSVPATERTTPEFMQMVRHGDWLNRPQGDALCDFLEAADMVKFARRDATVERMREALGVAARFVAETRPSSVAEGAAEAVQGGDK